MPQWSLKRREGTAITKLLEHIRGWLQSWFYVRRTHAMAYTNLVTDYAMTILKEAESVSRTYRVSPVDMYVLNVDDGHLGGLVDLRSRTCTCMEFNCMEIPCSHAVAAAALRNINIQTLCSKWFTVECVLAAYAEPIYPVGHRQEWRQRPDFDDFEILPPRKVPSVGRRQTIRIPSTSEEPRQVHKCMRCGQRGHNRKTCRQPLMTPATGTHGMHET